MATGDLGYIQASSLRGGQQEAGALEAFVLQVAAGGTALLSNSRVKWRLEIPAAAATRSQLNSGSSRWSWIYCLAASR